MTTTASATLRAPGAGDAAVSVLAPLLKANGFDLAFNMLNIGALPIKGAEEPFWQLLDIFPASSVAGVELDPRLCAEMNSHARERVRYYPAAIGRTEENRALYRTVHPMCTSLYRPDERYSDLYHDLESARLKSVGEITTVSLDKFVADHALGEIDFLKIDVQGAEFDVFTGGKHALAGMLLIVSEVEFVPIYEQQPLFGDVAACLRAHGMMFHKFLGMAGRVMKPLTVQGSAHYPAQFMWSDAVFVRDLLAFADLSMEQLLKLAVLLDIYESKDAALHVLRRYDAGEGDNLGDIYLSHLAQGGAWNVLPSADKGG
ncbi:MAG: FkbM family methyltransferase [Burkholderiales bacterium]